MMAMDLDAKAGGTQVVKLGMAERWILAGVGLVLVSALGFAGSKLSKVDAIDTRTQVTNTKLDAMQTTLIDLPDLRRTQIELKVKVQRIEKEQDGLRTDITEIQKLKGL